jgi:hypothetical protein
MIEVAKLKKIFVSHNNPLFFNTDTVSSLKEDTVSFEDTVSYTLSKKTISFSPHTDISYPPPLS